ncbi:hypothetical protein GQ473_00835 [archaeon]|nr:hypothetical protein [archaeon]
MSNKIDKIEQVDNKNVYSFVSGAFFMAASLIIPISIVYTNTNLIVYGAVCLFISLYYVNLFSK